MDSEQKDSHMACVLGRKLAHPSICFALFIVMSVLGIF